MLLLAAATLVASSPQKAMHQISGPVVQARATVRIISGARLEWGEGQAGVPKERKTVIRTTSGPQQATLIEFE